MSRQWRPDLDLVRLSEAFAEEIIGADDRELAALAATIGSPLAGAAREVRGLIEPAAGDRSDALPPAIAALAAHARQH